MSNGGIGVRYAPIISIHALIGSSIFAFSKWCLCMQRLSRLSHQLRPRSSTRQLTTRMKTALIPIADGSEEIEAITLADVLVRGGVQVTLAAVGNKPNNIVTMSRGVKVQGDVAIEACTGKSFDLIVIPGGMPGAEHLRDSKEVTALLQQQKADGKLYGAICAAPAVVLHSHGLLAPGAATSYPSFEPTMTGVDYKHENVVLNGKCVTSQGPGTAMAMGVKLVELLCGHEKAQSVAQGLLNTPMP